MVFSREEIVSTSIYGGDGFCFRRFIAWIRVCKLAAIPERQQDGKALKIGPVNTSILPYIHHDGITHQDTYGDHRRNKEIWSGICLRRGDQKIHNEATNRINVGPITRCSPPNATSR